MFVKKLAYPIALSLICTLPGLGASKDAAAVAPQIATKRAVLWRNPADISSRNLFYGPGGRAHEPRGKFVFVKEDLDGTNPKFVVKDEDGVKWKVKLGNEARPETVASRIAWGVGFYANEDYYLRDLRVADMPARLHRGQNLVSRDGLMHDVRLKREDEKKTGTWQWRDSPFNGSRELNGLRVLMALINNWDLKDENNAIYKVGSENIYLVSDLGASFGSSSRTWPKDKSKGDFSSYQKSNFLGKTTTTSVSFHTPARSSFVYIVNPKEYFERIHMEGIGHNIPREDARWMGRLLAKLSPAQIRDAFRAAGYGHKEIEAFSAIVESRILTLTDL
jgi:hypothetical protein